eukprot:Nitzschia sp. Nitz4//scaffold131_size63436//6738//8081//NITZ4_006261-RA/size63436-processed-gene-0.93-mRNA-1//1//CDS//3329535226//2922//frame0
MNHLLDACSGYAVIGLRNKAYLLCSGSASFRELLHSDSTVSASPEETEGKEDTGDIRKQKTEEEIAEIHVVSIYKHESKIYCAVARGGKTLSLYQVSVEDSAETPLSPSWSYTSSKRISCGCFAMFPGDSSAPLYIAGDMAGDAYAYRLRQPLSPPRLLLGHTASMLTSLCVAGPNNSQLLTADRDEKVRISSFPSTVCIEGYLLGHTAYITDLTVVPQKPWVATSAGDYSIRLWDLETHESLLEVSFAKDQPQEEEEKEPESAEPEGRARFCKPGDGGQPVPTKVSVCPDGSWLTVIFDQSNVLEFYRIIQGDSKEAPSLELAQKISCPADVFGTAFLENQQLVVLVREPSILLAYTLSDGKWAQSSENGAMEAFQKKALNDQVVLPSALLERDQYDQIKLKKLHETRGPAAGEEPWNRVERVDIAKEANKRHKRRRREGNTASES